MSITAMKAALDALEWGNEPMAKEAITALRAAIEAQEQCEPVAWMHEQGNACFAGSISGIKGYHLPLYTHPAPIENCEPVAWRWSERGFWFSWTTDFTHHDKALRLNCPVEYAYTHPAPVEQCDHVPVTTFGGDYCIKCDAPIEKAKPVAWYDKKYGDFSRVNRIGWEPLYTHPAPVPAELPPVDLNTCPNCGGEADNGFDRGYPPNPYYCKKCMKEK
jgi:hypothetical protein